MADRVGTRSKAILFRGQDWTIAWWIPALRMPPYPESQDKYSFLVISCVVYYNTTCHLARKVFIEDAINSMTIENRQGFDIYHF